jgi:NIPSNAP
VSSRVFELRTYHTAPGALPALEARFRDHTTGLFERHGLETVAFFTPEDRRNTLVYLLSFDSREAADTAWAAFRADPEWIAAKAASEANGPIVEHIESVFLNPTDYSPLR